MSARTTLRALGLLLALALPPAARAQERRAQLEHEAAEALLARGQLVSAESVYYEAVRTRPRDPWARLNLGRHVLARGAGKVAAALLEEARFFGGDQALIAPELLAAYERAGMWRAITAFPGTALAPGERARAEALMARPGSAVGADSAVVPWGAGPAGTLGSVLLAVGGDTVRALVDPVVRGVWLDGATARRRGVRTFAREAGAVRVAVADTVRVGGVAWTQVPVRVDAGAAATTRVGLDWLGDAQATFDPVGRTLTVRRAPPDARTVRGARVPIVFTADGWGLVVGALTPLATPEGQGALSARRWTLLTARGEVAVLP